MSRNMKLLRQYLPSMSLILLLLGCANPGLDDLQQFISAEKAKSPGRIEPIPEIEQVESFLYEEQDRRDPFRPREEVASREVGLVETGIQPDYSRRKEELESFPLDALTMVGTLDQGGITWGLVQTKEDTDLGELEGTIHRVKSGNYMGTNHGRIVLITEDRIELSEIVQDGSGGYIERQASLALAE
jgi:type IV pilus assembly protein PilP